MMSAGVELVVELMKLPVELAMRSRWRVGLVKRSVADLTNLA